MMNYLVQEGNAASPGTFITEIAKRTEKHEEALMTIAEALKQEGKQEGYQIGREQGINEGIERGRYEGKLEGKLEGKQEVARQMLDSGMAPVTVKQFTGLTDSDILKLKN